jgi:hypothetical protein
MVYNIILCIKIKARVQQLVELRWPFPLRERVQVRSTASCSLSGNRYTHLWGRGAVRRHNAIGDAEQIHKAVAAARLQPLEPQIS